VGFEMPGAMIPGFTRKAAQIAQAGIYDLRIHHDEIVQPLLRHWAVFDIEGLDAQGEQARDELAEFVAGLSAQATRFDEQRARAQARLAGRQG
jgi:acyl-[acyl-carrier-protein] desaturase